MYYEGIKINPNSANKLKTETLNNLWKKLNPTKKENYNRKADLFNLKKERLLEIKKLKEFKLGKYFKDTKHFLYNELAIFQKDIP